MMAAVTRHNAERFKAVTWDRIKDETSRDQGLLRLTEAIISGFHTPL